MALRSRSNFNAIFAAQSQIVLILSLTVFSAIGCATQEDQQNLEKRVAALEEKQKAAEERERVLNQTQKDRQDKLESCVNVEADEVYWSYIRLNGKPVPSHPDQYTAPQYQWDHAEKMKKDKIEECRLLYGPR